MSEVERSPIRTPAVGPVQVWCWQGGERALLGNVESASWEKHRDDFAPASAFQSEHWCELRLSIEVGGE